MLKRVIILSLLMTTPTSIAIARERDGFDTRTANSTPQRIERRRSTVGERAAQHWARSRAARESARELGRAGLRNAGRAARWVSRRSGMAGEYFGNPATACAPTTDKGCN